MGEPMDRSNLFFSRPTSKWEEAFPTLEDAIIDYVESDFGGEERNGTVSLRRNGGILPCGNPRCFRGGYELDREVSRMVHDGVVEKTVTIHCPGDEGTPKRRRGDDCERSIKATIKLKPKLSEKEAIMSDNSQAQERAKQMVAGCPRGYWIVEDHYNNTVYYENQKPPNDTIPTDYAINHVLIAHQVFTPECTHHIAFDKHDPANKDSKRRYYLPVW